MQISMERAANTPLGSLSSSCKINQKIRCMAMLSACKNVTPSLTLGPPGSPCCARTPNLGFRLDCAPLKVPVRLLAGPLRAKEKARDNNQLYRLHGRRARALEDGKHRHAQVGAESKLGVSACMVLTDRSSHQLSQQSRPLWLCLKMILSPDCLGPQTRNCDCAGQH